LKILHSIEQLRLLAVGITLELLSANDVPHGGGILKFLRRQLVGFEYEEGAVEREPRAMLDNLRPDHG
tara:strand:- start:16269 stop:16472 length:204 start_codon:yes stop_codon:yes gene_type:complete